MCGIGGLIVRENLSKSSRVGFVSDVSVMLAPCVSLRVILANRFASIVLSARFVLECWPQFVA